MTVWEEFHVHGNRELAEALDALSELRPHTLLLQFSEELLEDRIPLVDLIRSGAIES